MKLHYSPQSQYVRKVMATAIETGMLDRIELIKDKKDLEKHNPLLKRPTLISDDGDPILDSPVICEYIDSLAGNKIIPKSGRARWKALTQEALADGAMEAAGGIQHDKQYHKGHESKEWHERQMLKVTQSLDAFEEQAASGDLGDVTIGTLTVAIMLGYFDFRHIVDWRKSHPALADWYETFSKRPSISKTMTVQQT